MSSARPSDGDTEPQAAADAALIAAARAGDGDAYAELWRRHADAGTAFARSLQSAFDPDDLVAESYFKILRALAAGQGPSGAFRSYLYTTIRNTAYSWQRRRREQQPLEDEQEQIPDPRAADVLAALEGSPSVEAFNRLPAIWQEVLWYVDIEGMNATEVARLLGTTPNAVAARSYRAREGLRQAWIQAQLDIVADGSEHQWTLERMGAFVRKGLSRRERNRVQRHLDECPRCSMIQGEAEQISSRLALVLVPAVTGLSGAALAGWLSAHQTAPVAAAVPAPVAGGGDAARPLRRNGRRAAYAAAGAAAIAVAVLNWRAEPLPEPAHPGRTASSAPVPTVSVTPSPTSPPEPPAAASSPAAPVQPVPPRAATAVPASSAPAPLAPAVLEVPRVLRPADGALSNSTLLRISGKATPGSTITIGTAAGPIGQTAAGPDGSWSATADVSALGDGAHRIEVTSSHPGSRPTRRVIEIRVDRRVAIPAELTATRTEAGIVISGVADPGSAVLVRGRGTAAKAVADARGRWRTGALTTLPAGYSTVTATATDAAGNVSPPSAPLGVTVP